MNNLKRNYLLGFIISLCTSGITLAQKDSVVVTNLAGVSCMYFYKCINGGTRHIISSSDNAKAIPLQAAISNRIDTIFYTMIPYRPSDEGCFIEDIDYEIVFGYGDSQGLRAAMPIIYSDDSLNALVPDYRAYQTALYLRNPFGSNEPYNQSQIKDLMDYNVFYMTFRTELQIKSLGRMKVRWMNLKYRKWKFWTKPFKIIHPVVCQITKVRRIKPISIKDVYSPEQLRKLKLLYPKI